MLCLTFPELQYLERESPDCQPVSKILPAQSRKRELAFDVVKKIDQLTLET